MKRVIIYRYGSRLQVRVEEEHDHGDAVVMLTELCADLPGDRIEAARAVRDALVQALWVEAGGRPVESLPPER